MSACTLFDGALDSDGYGSRWYKGRVLGAHRVAWMEARGPIPAGMCVCHTCDTPACVNIEHLFLGTHTDNMRDCRAKGRMNRARGSRNGYARLSEGWVRAGRALAAAGIRHGAIAAELNVHRCTVKDFCTGRTWAHVA